MNSSDFLNKYPPQKKKYFTGKVKIVLKTFCDMKRTENNGIIYAFNYAQHNNVGKAEEEKTY